VFVELANVIAPPPLMNSLIPVEFALPGFPDAKLPAIGALMAALTPLATVTAGFVPLSVRVPEPLAAMV